MKNILIFFKYLRYATPGKDELISILKETSFVPQF